MRVAAVAVAARDTAVEIVDAQFGVLAAAHQAARIYGLRLGVVVAARALAAAAFHIPATSAVMDDMVAIGSFMGHFLHLRYEVVRYTSNDWNVRLSSAFSFGIVEQD